jgi:acyl-CoA synthetase (NDP forming)
MRFDDFAKTPTSMIEKSTLKKNLARLLSPQHIAFVGGRYATAALERCRQFGFDGPLWHVNPQAKESVTGQVFASIKELPQPPDAVYLAVSTNKTIEAVRELAERGAGGCVCFAAGFAEKGGDGVALQNELIEVAGDLALIGPNCFGLLEYRRGLHLWSGDAHKRFAGPGIGIVSQSGALAEFMTMEHRSVPFVSVITVGNQAIVTLEHVLNAMLDDDGINAIGLYIEGLTNIPWFSRLAAKALRKRVALVAIKIGRSPTGVAIAKGHTSSLAGSAELYDALFERFGIVQANSLSEFLETLKLFSLAGPLPGSRVASVTVSGGQAAMLADRAAEFGLTFPPLTPIQRGRLRDGLPDYVTPMNPLDMTIGPMGVAEQQALIFDVMAGGDIDVVTTALDAYDGEDAPFFEETVMMLEQLALALKHHGKIGIASSAMIETLPEQFRRRAIEAGLVPLQGSEEMLFAIRAGAAYGARVKMWQATHVDEGVLSAPPIHDGPVNALDERSAKQILASIGLNIPTSRVVAPDDVVMTANELGYPLVLKVVDSELFHKSDVGGVALGLRDEASVIRALDRMQAVLSRTPQEILVERMVERVVAEMIVGVTFDAAFGHALVIGAGGIFVELIRDSQTLLLPASRDEIELAIERLSIVALLNGFRGKPAGDKQAAVEAISAIGNYALAEREHLVELDVNPLLVLEAGKGVVVADALIRRID